MASAAHTTMTAGYVIDGLKVIIDGGLCRGRSSTKVAPKTSSLCRSFHKFEHFFSFFLCEMSAGDVALFPSWGEERVINIRRRKRGGLPRDRADFSRLHHPQLKRENVKIRAGL